MSTPISAEHSAILSCLKRIRRRLFTVRLAERLAISLAWAAAVALFTTSPRLIHAQLLWQAILIAAVPLLAALWLFLKSDRVLKPHSALVAWGLTPNFVRLLAIITALVSIATIINLLWPFTPTMPIWAFPIATIVPFLIAAAATVRPAAPGTVAIFVDRQVGLKERVSTALELVQSKSVGGITPLEAAFHKPVIDSAITACTRVRDAKVGYARIDSRIYPLAATFALAAAAICFVPPLQVQGRPNLTHHTRVVDAGKTIAEKLKELENDPKTPKDPAAQKKLELFNQIANDMRKGEMTPFEASQRLAGAMQEIQAEQERAKAASAMEKLGQDFSDVNRAGQEARNAEVNSAKAGQAEAAQQKAASKSQIAKAAGELGDKLKGMSKTERDNLADKLENAAKDAKGDPDLKEKLEQAAQAAREGNSDQFSKSMADATSRAAEQSAQGATQQDINESMDKLARAAQAGSSGQQNGGGGENNPSGKQEGQGNPGGDQSANNNANNQNSGNNGQGNEGNAGNQGNSGSAQANSGNNGQSGEGGTEGGAGKSSAGGPDSNEGNGGSTDMSAPSGPGGRNNNGKVGGVGTWVRIYDERKTETTGRDQSIKGAINPIAPPSATIETTFVPGKGPSDLTTYQSVKPQLQKKYLDDIETQQIPPQHRDFIRNFFDEKK